MGDPKGNQIWDESGPKDLAACETAEAQERLERPPKVTSYGIPKRLPVMG